MRKHRGTAAENFILDTEHKKTNIFTKFKHKKKKKKKVRYQVFKKWSMIINGCSLMGSVSYPKFSNLQFVGYMGLCILRN